MTPQGEPATVILASTTDLASRTLAAALVEGEGFASTGVNFLGEPVYQKESFLLARFEGMIVTPPDLDEYFNPQAYIFLSRHSAESGIASLTAHTTGNFSEKTEIGGVGRELGRADASLLKNYLIALWGHRGEVSGYEITMEATHHGPTSLQKPVLFVELGSSEEQWGDSKAAGVVAKSLMESLTHKRTWDRIALGFGGTHYPEKFTRLLLDEDLAIPYVAPKYALEHVDEQMVGQMLQRSTSAVRYAVLDWKGLGPHKEKIVRLAKQFGLEEIRV
ncbi:MAG: D-tyrosyl-tRNA(Tyr) deacylase [Nitrososphaerota archaeon]|jgi:D-aminoacyl-tRNA deacylase|nr:D-tyrosyl-tRNA(Tyr) deacylase [Nitrososphaerota archaeon]MDG6941492.1 D-tyrosyl-tRNA(Tyr) deacylase [Nitrososphaerota archaeon]MDG6951033.1 D-tyrosyl-tRNA(Tyr) deacylase [Nitrososphaerota archaeon]